MKFIFLFLMLLIILFMPIPIIFNVSYHNDLKIYLYKKSIFSLEKFKNKSKNKKSKKKKHMNIDFKHIFNILQNNKFKPLLNLNINIDYSLNDAALTAISVGLLSATLESICLFLMTFLNLKKSKYNLKPMFIEKNEIFLSIKGIFYLSFANILYILILYLSKKK